MKTDISQTFSVPRITVLFELRTRPAVDRLEQTISTDKCLWVFLPQMALSYCLLRHKRESQRTTLVIRFGKKFLLFLGYLCEHRRIQEYISSDFRAGWIGRTLQADWESLFPIGHNVVQSGNKRS